MSRPIEVIAKVFQAIIAIPVVLVACLLPFILLYVAGLVFWLIVGFVASLFN